MTTIELKAQAFDAIRELQNRQLAVQQQNEVLSQIVAAVNEAEKQEVDAVEQHTT